MGIEVLLRRDGEALTLVRRLSPPWLAAVMIGAVPALSLLLCAVALTLRTQVELRCARAADACEVRVDGRLRARTELSTTLRFEVRALRHGGELVAVGREVTVPLLRDRQDALRAQVVGLNALLHDPAIPERAVVLESARELRARVVPALAILSVAFLVLGWMVLGRQEVRFDRSRNLAVRRWPLSPGVRRLDALRGVRIRTRADEQRERLARGGRGMALGRRGARGRQIVVDEADGKVWPVTLYVDPEAAVTDLDAVAAELAEFLRLPLTRAST